MTGRGGLADVARYVSFGASPRASINLVLGALGARLHPRPRLRVPPTAELTGDVLRHRLVLSYEALADDVSADDLLDPLLAAVPAARHPDARARRKPGSAALSHRDVGQRDGVEHWSEYVVRRDVVRQRLVGEHQAVAQHVPGEVADITGSA